VSFNTDLEKIIDRDSANDIYNKYYLRFRENSDQMGMFIDALWDVALDVGQTEGYKEARRDGFQIDEDDNTEYENGFEDGREAGMDDGWENGFEEGERQGYEKGYQEGMHEGKGDGISEGFANAERLYNEKLREAIAGLQEANAKLDEANARIDELNNQKIA
jgi:flagellar biosynthesis/type III secretory pathway protein FliH